MFAFEHPERWPGIAVEKRVGLTMTANKIAALNWYWRIQFEHHWFQSAQVARFPRQSVSWTLGENGHPPP